VCISTTLGILFFWRFALAVITKFPILTFDVILLHDCCMTISDDIAAKLDIVELVSRYVSLKKTGSNYSWLCPFHNEKTPSFTVSPGKQIFKCFGCGAGGNAIKFYADIERIEYGEAVRHFVTTLGLETQQSSFRGLLTTDQYTQITEQRHSLYAIYQQVIEWSMIQLQRHQHAYTYVTQTRHLSDQILLSFQLGYSPRDPQVFLAFVAEQGWSRNDLVMAGLLKADGWQVVFRDRIMIPIFDAMGKPIWFGARIINPDDQPKYLNTPESPLYHKSKILYNYHRAKKTKQGIVVVEGYMDVIAIARMWHDNAVATCGTALTQDHARLLTKLAVPIFFLFDNDTAGQQAFLRALEMVLAFDCYPKRLTLPPEYKDVDDFVNGRIDAGKEWETLCAQASDAMTWFISTYDSSRDPQKKQDWKQHFFSLLAVIPSMSMMHEYLTIFANTQGTPVPLIQADFVAFGKKKKRCWQQSSDVVVHKDIPAILVSASVFAQGWDTGLAETIRECTAALALDVDESRRDQRELWWGTQIPDPQTQKSRFVSHYIMLFQQYLRTITDPHIRKQASLALVPLLQAKH